MPIDDVDKFENKMKEIRPIKNTWYDWLINYILEPIRKSVGGFKDKVISLFKTNTPKQTVYERGKKLSKPKTQNKINSIRNPFILKKNKATINSKIKDDKCFQYAVTVALNYGKIESLPERVSNIKPFIKKYNCKIINYLPKRDDWKTLEKNNPTTALNILYIKEKNVQVIFRLYLKN